LDEKIKIKVKRCFQPIFNNDYRYLVYKGGRASGKSWGIVDSLILCARLKCERILCTREFQSSLAKSAYQLICDRIKYYDFTDFKITQTSIVNKITGSEFMFAGLSDITGTDESIKSIEGITICWVEEAQSVSDRSWKILTPSIRGENSKIIISYNPDTSATPVHRRFVETPSSKTFICHINYMDNKYCPQEMIDEAKRCKFLFPEEYDNIWLGQLRDTSKTAVVKYWSSDNVADVDYLPDEDLILTTDFNVDPMMWAVGHKTKDSMSFFDEIVIDNCTTEDAAYEFVRRYPNHKGFIYVCGDASGNYRKTQSNYTDYAIIINSLKAHGYRPEKIILNIRGFNPPIQHRIQAFNRMVLNDKGERRVKVDPKCRMIIRNMTELNYKPGTSIINLPTPGQIKADEELKYMGHIFDAISYPVEYYWPVVLSSEKPQQSKQDNPYTFGNVFERTRKEKRKDKW
jgi:hypothetical protein